MSWAKAKLITYGFLLGTAGVKILTSPEAKKVYTGVTSLGFRCADDLMKTVQTVRENCEDIVADAKAILESAKEKNA